MRTMCCVCDCFVERPPYERKKVGGCGLGFEFEFVSWVTCVVGVIRLELVGRPVEWTKSSIDVSVLSLSQAFLANPSVRN